MQESKIIICTYCGDEIKAIDRIAEMEDGTTMHLNCALDDGAEISFDDEDEEEGEDE